MTSLFSLLTHARNERAILYVPLSDREPELRIAAQDGKIVVGYDALSAEEEHALACCVAGRPSPMASGSIQRVLLDDVCVAAVSISLTSGAVADDVAFASRSRRAAELVAALLELQRAQTALRKPPLRGVATAGSLRESAHLESVVANSFNPIFVVDRRGFITGWNTSAERQFGFKAGEALGHALNDLIVPPHLHRVAINVLIRARAGESMELETDLRSKDGSTGCYILTASPVTGERGEVVAVSGVLKDISRRKDGEAAINRFNIQLKGVNDVSAALHGAADLSTVLHDTLVSTLSILDADGAVLWRFDPQRGALNAVMGAGIAPTDMTTAERSIAGDADSAVRRSIARREIVVIDDIEMSDLAAGVKRVAAELEVNQVVALPLMDRGRVVGALELVSRVARRFSPTDLETMRLVQGQFALAFGRAKMFDEIRDQKSTLEQVLAGTADGVYVTAADGSFILWNVAAARIAGVPEDEAMTQGYSVVSGVDRRGRSLEDLDRAAFDAASADSASRQTVQNYEVYFGKTARWVAVSASPLRNAAGAVTAMVHAFRDITAAREVEQLKADFISTVSHELRTPLTSIKGATALLFEQVPADASGALELLQMVRNNSERLLRLINDLLDASKIEAGKLTIRKQPCDPTRLLERAIAGVAGYADEYGVAVTSEFARGLAPVVVDPDRVEQIMSNLISNAVKYSHRGDAVTVRVRSDGPFLRVDVIDTGVGIPASALPRLFEKFSQVDRGGRNRPGTGLGLVISKGLIEAHGGSISVSSTEGEGTTFTFTLPFAKRGADRA
jgi:PAS domain S-box-containing protein